MYVHNYVHECTLKEPWNHIPQVIDGGTFNCNNCIDLFLIMSVLRMNHGAISNHQIVWWGLLRFFPITIFYYSIVYIFNDLEVAKRLYLM